MQNFNLLIFYIVVGLA